MDIANSKKVSVTAFVVRNGKFLKTKLVSNPKNSPINNETMPKTTN
jgi:hypothetical protein